MARRQMHQAFTFLGHGVGLSCHNYEWSGVIPQISRVLGRLQRLGDGGHDRTPQKRREWPKADLLSSDISLCQEKGCELCRVFRTIRKSGGSACRKSYR